MADQGNQGGAPAAGADGVAAAGAADGSKDGASGADGAKAGGDAGSVLGDAAGGGKKDGADGVAAAGAADASKDGAAGADGAKAGGDAGSVLGDAAAAADGAKKDGDASGSEKKSDDPAAPAPEKVAEFVAKIKPVDLGLGVDADGKPIGWDSGAVQAVAPVLMQLGLDEAKSQKLMEVFAGYQKEQYKAQQQADAQLQVAMRDECKQVLGADFQRTAVEAYRGGVEVFGKELFDEFVRVPAFGNDVRVIQALAAVGRAVTDDRGAGSGSGSAGAGRDRPLEDRLYPESAFKGAAGK